MINRYTEYKSSLQPTIGVQPISVISNPIHILNALSAAQVAALVRPQIARTDCGTGHYTPMASVAWFAAGCICVLALLLIPSGRLCHLRAGRHRLRQFPL
jgi:hypothetical protein